MYTPSPQVSREYGGAFLHVPKAASRVTISLRSCPRMVNRSEGTREENSGQAQKGSGI